MSDLKWYTCSAGKCHSRTGPPDCEHNKSTGNFAGAMLAAATGQAVKDKPSTATTEPMIEIGAPARADLHLALDQMIARLQTQFNVRHASGTPPLGRQANIRIANGLSVPILFYKHIEARYGMGLLGAEKSLELKQAYVSWLGLQALAA